MLFIGAIIAFVIGKTLWSFWLLVGSLLHAGFTLFWVSINPDWYIRKRTAAGLDVDIFNPTAQFKITKVITLAALAALIFYVGQKVGYF